MLQILGVHGSELPCIKLKIKDYLEGIPFQTKDISSTNECMNKLGPLLTSDVVCATQPQLEKNPIEKWVNVPEDTQRVLKNYDHSIVRINDVLKSM